MYGVSDMAKSETGAAKVTPDLFTKKTIQGRPPKPGALTAAQRQAKFRASRLQVNLGETMTETVKRLAADFDLSTDEVMGHLVRFALTNHQWSKTGFPSRN